MDKKNKGYTVLSDVDHKMQFVNIIGIINELTPTIKRNKMLGNVLVELKDATLSDPGFFTIINLDSEVLDQFLAVAKKGLVIEFWDIEVTKNDGEIRGEVWNEEELRLYDDDGVRLKWRLNEKLHSHFSKMVKSTIDKLLKWKKQSTNMISKTPKEHTKPQKKSLRNESLSLESPKNSSISRKKATSADDKDNISEDINTKKQKVTADIANTKTHICKRTSPRSSKKENLISNNTIIKMDGKPKLLDDEAENFDLVSPDISMEKGSINVVQKVLRGVTQDSSEHNKGLPHVTSSGNSKNKVVRDKTMTKVENKNTKKKLIQENSRNSRSFVKSNESCFNDSSSNSERETTLNKRDSCVRKSKGNKSSPLINKSIEKIPRYGSKLSGSKFHLITSSSSSSISSNESHSKRDLVDSDSPKNKTVINSPKGLKKQIKQSNVKKKIQSTPSISKDIDNKNIQLSDCSSSKLTRSSSLTTVAQITFKNSERFVSPFRKRKLNSSCESLTKEPLNSGSKKNKSQNLKLEREKEILRLFEENKCSTPIINTKNQCAQNKETPSNTDKSKNLEPTLVEPSKVENTVASSLKSAKQNSVLLDTKRSPARRKRLGNNQPLTPSQLLSKPKDQEEGVKKLKSTSINSNNKKISTDKKDLMSYLGLLTRHLHLREVEFNGDISICEIEEIDVPEKFDLQCQVVSEFRLFDENIQIVRVIDGTVCKAPTLRVPESNSWDEVVATIFKNPTVEKNSPCVDIIIFDFPRMDTPVVSGKMYEFKNVMAIKLNLKDDPRKEKKPKGELFFCAKGPNMYVKPLNLTQRRDIVEKLKDEKYKQVCIDVGAEIKSPVNKKRKLPENNIDKNEESQNKKGRKVDCEDNLCNKGEKETKNGEEIQTQSKTNYTALSDETMLGETECQIIRELSEIMHEESLLGLPQTISEDIHLKNTGSQITFSEFCDGAKEKSANFRTSTQVESLSEDIAPLNQKEPSHTPDSSKMEPLIYCPSSSSLSETNSPLKGKKTPENTGACSESLLQNYTVKSTSDAPSIIISENNSPNLMNNDVSSVEVISSNSSDLQFEIVKKVIPNQNNIPVNEKNNKQFGDSIASETVIANRTSEDDPKNNTPEKSLEKEDCEDNFDESKVMSESSSTTVSDFSFKNCIQSSTTHEKPSDTSTNTCNRATVMDDPMAKNNGRIIINPKGEDLKRISQSCFYKSNYQFRHLSAEEINDIYNDENNQKYFSYSLDRHLPFVTLDIIRMADKHNHITVAVTIEKISPPLTDGWQEDCIKSRCSSCNTLYSSYNALNNKSSENATSEKALYIRGLIVCPESQCCNQVLESPEFHFSMDVKLKDGTPVTALLAGTHAVEMFGCKAQEVAKDETALHHVEVILRQIATKINERQAVKIDFTRVNICDPTSGPLYIKKIHF